MKIRIVKVGNPGYWYANKIGEVFDTKTAGLNLYANHDGTLKRVLREDCEEVIEHNSQLYRKVARPVREGDTVLITELDGEEMNRIFTVERLSTFPGDFRINEFINDDNYVEAGVDKYAIVEPIETPTTPQPPSYAEVSELLHEAKEETKEDDDIITHDGKQYRKVKRKAAIGELVIGIQHDDYIASIDGYIVGNVYMVTRLTEESDETIKYDVDNMFSDGTPLFLYESEFNVLEPIESTPALTEFDLIANLAQEVAELKRRLPDTKGTNVRIGDLDNRTKVLAGQIDGLQRELNHAQSDIVDLEDRLDENEKDTEEVIGRMNDLGDGVKEARFKRSNLISELERRRHEALCKRDRYEDMGDEGTYRYFDGKMVALIEVIGIVKETLRND